MLWLASILGMVAVGSAIMIDFESDDADSDETNPDAEADGTGSTIVSPDEFLTGVDPAGDDASDTTETDESPQVADGDDTDESNIILGTEDLDQLSGGATDAEISGLGGDDPPVHRAKFAVRLFAFPRTVADAGGLRLSQYRHSADSPLSLHVPLVSGRSPV